MTNSIKAALKQPVLAFAFIVLSYFVFGVSGTLFKIEPGFASAIWPAAGCAIVLALRYGQFAYLPLFIGSLLTNLYSSGASVYSLSFDDFAWNSSRSFGAVAQAYFSCLLLNKFCKFPLNLNSAFELFRALLLVSPLACVVSALIGAATLYLQGVIPLSIISFVWFTWWIGDTVGVLFFFPLLLILFPSKYYSPISNKGIVITIGVILFAFVSISFNYSKSIFKKNLQIEFSELTERKFTEIRIFKRQIERNLFALGAIFRSGHDPDINEFQYIAESLNNGVIPYRAIAWLDIVQRSNASNWYEKQNLRGLFDARIKSIEPKLEKDYIYPISLTAPYSTNSLAIGLDLASHPVAGKAVFEAIRNRNLQSTPPIRLAQQLDKFSGNVIYYPVFDYKGDKLLGFTEIVIEVDKQFEKLLVDENQSGSYRFNVTDREDIAHPFILGIEEVEFKTTRFSESYTLDWFGREWVIDFESTEAYGDRNKDWLSWLTLIVGLVIAALGMSFTLITTEFNDQLKREVKFKTTQLASAVRRLKKLDHVKNEFIANMSHEIRTPLNVVLGTLQLLQQLQQQKKEKELIESALSSGKTLLSIINDILDMSKLEAGKLSIEETRFDLHKLITDTVKEQITLAKNKGLSLEADVANTLVGTWRGDPTRIKQILLNLISNSIKFTDQGKVEIVATQSKHGVVFDIVDTGIGIPKEKLALLFKRFEQADTSTTRRFGGTGLGLAIVEQLVQLMKGDISVESDFNKGSQFKVRLPLEKCDPELQTESPQENKTMPNLNNCKILLAEDNAVNQVVFKAIFAESDAAISIAQNGKEAVDMFGDVKPDIIFMDIQMPIMDGEQACVEIRRKDKTIPVIALTANVLESDVKRYLAKGFTRHLAKPIDLNSLIEVVSSNIIK